jgi:hypothetical protein
MQHAVLSGGLLSVQMHCRIGTRDLFTTRTLHEQRHACVHVLYDIRMLELHICERRTFAYLMSIFPFAAMYFRLYNMRVVRSVFMRLSSRLPDICVGQSECVCVRADGYVGKTSDKHFDR